MEKTQAMSRKFAEEMHQFRQEFDTKTGALSTSQQHVISQLRQDLEDRIASSISQQRSSTPAPLEQTHHRQESRIFDAKVAQVQSSTQRLVKDLRHEVESRATKAQEAMHRLREDTQQDFRDVEARASGRLQELAKDLREELHLGLRDAETRATKGQEGLQRLRDEVGPCIRDVPSLRTGLEALQRQQSDFRKG